MTIPYSYEIVLVDEAARCMEVRYASEGRQTLHVGVRLPFEGESLQDVIQSFAPFGYWEEQERPVVAPEVGATGVIDPAEQGQAAQQAQEVLPLYPEYEVDKSGAAAFLASKGMPDDVSYILSMYNITTRALLANLFRCGNQLVKVLNGTPIEWYQAGVVLGEEPYAYVSKDLQTGEVIDKYIIDQRGLVKVTQDPSAEPTITNIGTFASMPPLLQPLVEGFEHYERIRAWSLKPYGLVVEYTRG